MCLLMASCSADAGVTQATELDPCAEDHSFDILVKPTQCGDNLRIKDDGEYLYFPSVCDPFWTLDECSKINLLIINCGFDDVELGMTGLYTIELDWENRSIDWSLQMRAISGATVCIEEGTQEL